MGTTTLVSHLQIFVFGTEIHAGVGVDELDWISKLAAPSEQHNLVFEKIGQVPQSGNWLLQTDRFMTWKSSLSTSVLWLHGIPGSGKSTLVSKVIDSLFNESNPYRIAYFYCVRDPARPELSVTKNVYRCLLRQLSCEKNTKTFKPEILAFYNSKNKGDIPGEGSGVEILNMNDCIKLLISVLQGTTTYILIDALDELKERERPDFFEILTRILEEVQGTIRVFLASRDDGDIVRELSVHSNVYIRATNNEHDIERHIISRIEKSKKRLLRGAGIDDDLKQEIMDALISGANGM